MRLRINIFTVLVLSFAVLSLPVNSFAQAKRTVKPKTTRTGPGGRATLTEGGATTTGTRGAGGKYTVTDEDGNPVAEGRGAAGVIKTEEGAAGAGAVQGTNVLGGSRSASGGFAGKVGEGAAWKGKTSVERANGSTTQASGSGTYDAQSGIANTNRNLEGTTKEGGSYSSDVDKTVDTESGTSSTSKTVSGTNAEGETKSATVEKEAELGEGADVTVETGSGEMKDISVPSRPRFRR